MSELNITPSAWYSQDIRAGQYGALRGFRVYSENGPIVSRVFRRADAQLISASPKLLDALESLKLPHGCYCEVEADSETFNPHSEVCRNARAALAQALGQPFQEY